MNRYLISYTKIREGGLIVSSHYEILATDAKIAADRVFTGVSKDEKLIYYSVLLMDDEPKLSWFTVEQNEPDQTTNT